jgi:hypothetical protein
MPSTFTWLDTSEHDRRRALEVVDLFRLQDTRDELGLAGVRDAWADRLVPGTSTIQTRARYFLFVPWIYRRLEGKAGPADVDRRARRAELALIDAIEATDPEAVPIGAQAGKGLKRLPSSIYWNGMGTLGVRLWAGSQAAFHREFGSWAREGDGGGPWNPHLPEAPEDFPERASLDLTAAEATFLREQVRLRAPGSLLGFLMERDEFAEGIEFPWEHPARAEMPEQLEGWLAHAEAFALHLHGAALLYNRLLAERRVEFGMGDADEWVESYGEEFGTWAGELEQWRASAPAWDRDGFWRWTLEQAPRLPGSVRLFCDGWIDRVERAAAPAALLDDEGARRMVSEREHRLKRNRSRLKHREHLERWRGASSARRLEYRWGITQRLVRDVIDGLARGEAN